MKKAISVIGGDERNIYLAEMLVNSGYQVHTYGLKNNNENVVDIIKKSDIIISAIPFSKDGININAPISEDKISIDILLENLENKFFIAGSIQEKIKQELQKKKIKYFDLMDDEKVTILNTIATAEGALQIAMENTKITIDSSRVLVLGFGRVGKTVAKLFSNMGAQVYCEARKREDLAWIETLGYIPIKLENMLENLYAYDIIINTVPALILDKKELQLVKSESIIIDLASAPGGVNHEEANRLQLKSILALGLPGKVAPETSAKILKETIEEII